MKCSHTHEEYLQENRKGCNLIKKQHENRRRQKEEVQEQREKNKREQHRETWL